MPPLPRDLHRVPDVARRQAGTFTREQALAEGWTPAQVTYRLRQGVWRRHAGRAVVASEPVQQPAAGVWAVHLTWPDAVASHRTAALAHRFPVPVEGRVHATSRAGRSIADLVVHQVDLPTGDVLRLPGGPLLTDRRRTALDCLRTMPSDEGARLLAWCLTHDVLTRDDLRHAVLDGYGRHGTPALLALLRAGASGAVSAAERRMHEVLRRAGIDGWVANERVVVDGRVVAVVDLLFRRQRIAVEVDGWEAHADRDAFERDRRRQNLLVNAGYLVLRFTWADLRDRPDEVVDVVRQALRRGERH